MCSAYCQQQQQEQMACFCYAESAWFATRCTVVAVSSSSSYMYVQRMPQAPTKPARARAQESPQTFRIWMEQQITTLLEVVPSAVVLDIQCNAIEMEKVYGRGTIFSSWLVLFRRFLSRLPLVASVGRSLTLPHLEVLIKMLNQALWLPCRWYRHYCCCCLLPKQVSDAAEVRKIWGVMGQEGPLDSK